MSDHKDKSKRPSYKYAVLSIAIVLFFLGAYLLLWMHHGRIDEAIERQMSVVVELHENTKADQSNAIQKLIADIEGVSSASVQLRNSEEATALLGLDEHELSQSDNPFRDMITFNMESGYYHSDYLESIKAKLSPMPEVADVVFADVSEIGIGAVLNRLSWLLLALSLIFVVLALIIIHNTLNLILYADRWEIKTMDLVGARRAFIRRPYIAHGRMIGQRAFLLAAVLLAVAIVGVFIYSQSIASLLSPLYIILTLLLLLLISTLISMWSTFTAVNKFLDQSLNDLHS